MATTLEVGVIGLGKFGLQLARTLHGLGHKVIGLDAAEGRISLAGDELDQVFRADAADVDVLRELRFQDLDCVVVSVGKAMELSLSITLNLQELGVRKIWVKASSIEHRKILKRLGVDHAILPEHDVATLTAHQLVNPGMLDFVPRYGGILMQELVVDDWAGKTLVELNLMNSARVLVLATRKHGTHEYVFVPMASTLLEKGDEVMVVGRKDDVLKLLP